MFISPTAALPGHEVWCNRKVVGIVDCVDTTTESVYVHFTPEGFEYLRESTLRVRTEARTLSTSQILPIEKHAPVTTPNGAIQVDFSHFYGTEDDEFALNSNLVRLIGLWIEG